VKVAVSFIVRIVGSVQNLFKVLNLRRVTNQKL
jgi:hypothetical protein